MAHSVRAFEKSRKSPRDVFAHHLKDQPFKRLASLLTNNRNNSVLSLSEWPLNDDWVFRGKACFGVLRGKKETLEWAAMSKETLIV